MNKSFEKYLKYKKKYLNLKKNGSIYSGGDPYTYNSFGSKEHNFIGTEEYNDLFIISDKAREEHKLGKHSQEKIIIKENKTNFIDLLKKYNPEEYEDLFIITDEAREQQKNGNFIQENNVNNNNNNNIIQSGSGKGSTSWNWIYYNFKRQLESNNLTIKISSLSSPFDNDNIDARYGGVIFWHNQENNHISTIDGHSVRSIYVLIQNTREWTGDRFRRQGGGMVHDYLYQQVVGNSLEETRAVNAACSSGFSIFHDHEDGWCIRFSSRWLNSNLTWGNIMSCGANVSKMTSQGEAIIIIGAIAQWIGKGPGNYHKLESVQKGWKNSKPLIDDLYWIINNSEAIPNPNDDTTWYNSDHGRWRYLPSTI
jgi:hypothetical protein